MVRERADNVNSAGGGNNDPSLVDFGNYAELYSKPGTVLAGGDIGGERADNSESSHGEQLAGELSRTWGPDAEVVPPALATAKDLPELDFTDRTKVAEAGKDASPVQAVEINDASKDAIASASRLAYNPEMAAKLYRSFDRIAQG